MNNLNPSSTPATLDKKKNPRWLILTQYYPPEIGAPQIRLRSLARELKRHGIQVEVLTALPNYPTGKIFPAYKGKWLIKEMIDGVPVLRTWIYPAAGKSAWKRMVNYFSFTAMALIIALVHKRPDVLFVESQPLSLGIIALVLKITRRVPYIYNVPDLQVDVARQLGFIHSERLLSLAWKMENLFLKHSWKVSTVTHKFISHFQERGLPASKITYLPNGADTEFLSPMPPSPELLARWNLDEKKIFAYVGTHALYHGLDALIDAATLLQQNREITFLMIGDGPERQRLKQIVLQRQLRNVVFGDSPYEEMARLYSIVYAAIATLKNVPVAQGMRLSKVFPALSCGVPVIYAGKGEAAELLEANQCGIVVPPENPAKLAEAILYLSQQPHLRNELGASGRSLVEKEYSWKIIVERWLDVLNLQAKYNLEGIETGN